MHVSLKLQLVHQTNCAQMKYMIQGDDPVLRRMVVNSVHTVCDYKKKQQ